MEKGFWPRESLRNKLIALGIPKEAHDAQALAGMLPVRLNGRLSNDLEADSLAEALIYLIEKEIIRVPCRLDALLDIGWGTHVCHFYHSDADLLELLASYFCLGLEHNEYCVWVVAPPLSAETVRAALVRAVPRFEHLERGIEFVDHEDWYIDGAGQQKTMDALLANWLGKIQQARDLGYQGLRCASNASAIEKKSWGGLVEYEGRVNAAASRLRIKAVCAYPLSGCGPRQMIDVRDSHQDVFVKRDAWWHRVATPDANEAKAVLMALQGGKS
jgi:hypothetical protein